MNFVSRGNGYEKPSLEKCKICRLVRCWKCANAKNSECCALIFCISGSLKSVAPFAIGSK